jgi:hypothetical protein
VDLDMRFSVPLTRSRRRLATWGWPGRRCGTGRCARRPAELQALIDGRVQAFCLTNGNLGFDEQAEWFVGNRHRIIQRCRKPGPCLWRLQGPAREALAEGLEARVPSSHVPARISPLCPFRPFRAAW